MRRVVTEHDDVRLTRAASNHTCEACMASGRTAMGRTSAGRTSRTSAHHLSGILKLRRLSSTLAVALVVCVCALTLPGCSSASSSSVGSAGSAALEAAKYQKIGNPTFGYINVPKEWVKIDTQEVATGDGSVAADLSQGIYYADSDGTDATVMVGMLSYGTFDHDLDDKAADEFVTTLEGAGYQNVTQVDRPIGGDISSYCFTVTMSSGNPGAVYLIKNGTNLIGIMISAADSDTVTTYLDLIQTSYATT